MRQKIDGAQVAILDTNVVLDWLVFGNPECGGLGSALRAGRLQWVATTVMRQELESVMSRGHLDAWQPDTATLWANWDRYCRLVPVPVSPGPPGRLRCSDPDDQKFIDLAVSIHANWLLTRDRAVLKLKRRLREHGVETVPPRAWVPAQVRATPGGT